MNDEVLPTANGSKADELIRQREFGIYLREARQAAGLTTTDVSDRLKLHEEIIKALENSRVDALPAPAFTMGYIKAYAKLLKIQPDEIMRAYDQMVPEKVTRLSSTSGVPAERSLSDSTVKTTGYVLIGVVIVLFVFWIQQSGFELSGNFAQVPGDVGQAGVTEPAETETGMPNAVSLLAGDGMDTQIMMDAASSMPVPGETPVEFRTEPASTKSPASIAPDSRSPSIDAVTVKTESRTEKRQEVRSVMVVNGGDVISLKSSEESWAEIQDADNNRLFYSLLNAGDEQSIKGRAPFRVFLGNAPSVSIKVNNQAVDISRYVRQNKIAHVKISASAATQTGGPRNTVNQVIDQYIPDTPAQ